MRHVTKYTHVQTIKKKLADGSVKLLYYYREPRVRLPDDPHSQAFYEAWQACHGQRRAQRRDNLETLFDRFLDSHAFRRLARSSQQNMRRDMKAIMARFGDMPMAALESHYMRKTKTVMLEWHEQLAKAHARAADAKLQVMQRVFSWAFKNGILHEHPLPTFTRAYKSDRAQNIWLPEHIAAFNAVASPSLRMALVVALHTGQRQGDLLRLQWDNYDGARLTMQQLKTGTNLIIPCTPHLQKTLDAARATSSCAHVLVNSRGLPWTNSGFRASWNKTFAASKIAADLHFHDLRGTTVTLLAESGCTTQEIASITGHRLKSAESILQAYSARTNRLAQTAIDKLTARIEEKL